MSGLQLGNVWIGVQPALGVEGDPMRLLFDRDLTPHPQYAAFYKWLQQEYKADAVVHFGMHGTVEWLPGAPLGESMYTQQMDYEDCIFHCLGCVAVSYCAFWDARHCGVGSRRRSPPVGEFMSIPASASC